MISRHGNYLDDILDWDYNPSDKQYYLASSFKLLDKIDVTEVVKMIFVNRRFVRDGISYLIEDVSFDMIQNRFIATAVYESDNEKIYTDVVIDRKIFSSMFDSLASTPGGQPFISEEGQVECVENLILCLRGGKDGKARRARSSAAFFRPKSAKRGARSPGRRKPPPL